MKHSIKASLITSFIVVIIALSIVMSVLHLLYSYNYITEESRNEISRVAEQVINNYEAGINELNVLMYQASSTLALPYAYNTYETSTKDRLQYQRDIEEKFNLLRRAFSFAEQIAWIDRMGYLIYVSDSVIRTGAFAENPCVQAIRNSDADTLIIPTFTRNYLNNESQTPALCYIKCMYSFDKQRTIKGYLQIDTSYAFLDNMFTEFDSISNSYVYIKDSQNRIVWSQQWKALGEDEGALQQVYGDLLAKGLKTELKYALDHDWTLCITYSVALIPRLISYAQVFMIVTLCMILIATVLTIIKSKRLSEPLVKLTSRLQDIEHGSPDKIRQDSKFTEIQALTMGYNYMVDRLDDMGQRIADIKIETAQAKITALQSQINPHFLANTLDLIRSLAIKDGNLDIENITDSLVMMYRFLLTKGETKIKLEQELEYVKNYVRIQKYRFENQYEVYYNISPELMGCEILCLSIQPLVENAFGHGLHNKKSSQQIFISCTRQENTLNIQVMDNGQGMSEKRLEEVRNYLADTVAALTPKKTKLKPESTGTGLKNVDMRLVLCYGEGAALRITSKPRQGTTISYSIPFKQ